VPIFDELTTRAAMMAALLFVVPLLVQISKGCGLTMRWAPLLALALGIAGAFLAVQAVPAPPQPWGATVVNGLVLGLASIGLFSGGRATLFPPPR